MKEEVGSSAILSSHQKGEAGEYAVASELAIRGWMVDMPRRGARSIDLYAHRFQDSRTCGVQVKARSRGDLTLSDGLLTFADPAADSWVVLVTLADAGSRSRFSVVPRNHITLAMRAFQGLMDNEGKPWTRKMPTGVRKL